MSPPSPSPLSSVRCLAGDVWYRCQNYRILCHSHLAVIVNEDPLQVSHLYIYLPPPSRYLHMNMCELDHIWTCIHIRTHLTCSRISQILGVQKHAHADSQKLSPHLFSSAPSPRTKCEEDLNPQPIPELTVSGSIGVQVHGSLMGSHNDGMGHPPRHGDKWCCLHANTLRGHSRLRGILRGHLLQGLQGAPAVIGVCLSSEFAQRSPVKERGEGPSHLIVMSATSAPIRSCHLFGYERIFRAPRHVLGTCGWCVNSQT